mgnify:CR=1 FL=1
MELRHLRYFIALAGSLNFTRAAERLHVTQSTLSHQIKQLEDELGRPLFDRVGKRVALTEAGDEFLHHATRALQEIDLGLGALRRDGSDMAGELRIGATHSFNLGFIPDCIAAFQQKHPQERIRTQACSWTSVDLVTIKFLIFIVQRKTKLENSIVQHQSFEQFESCYEEVALEGP